MQPIERYGVIALIFLVITLAAAWLWTPDKEEADTLSENTVAAAERGKIQVSAPIARKGRALNRNDPAKQPRQQPWNRGGALREKQGGSAPVVNGDEIVSLDAGGRDPAFRVEAQPIDAPGSRSVTPVARDEASTRPLQRRPEKRLYVVKSGDTLSEISQRELGTSTRWQEIVELNPGLDPLRLRADTRLVMPAPRERSSGEPASAPPRREPSASPPRPRGSRTYVVQQDDSLWRIAARTLGDGARWMEIAKLNPTLDPDRLTAGDELVLPGSASLAAASRVASATPRSADTTGGKGVVR